MARRAGSNSGSRMAELRSQHGSPSLANRSSSRTCRNRLIEAKDLQDGDLFELANGTIFTTSSVLGVAGTRRVRALCSHPPDPIAFDPPLVDLPPTQRVQLLTGPEMETHRFHPGYVETVFRQEMEQRHAQRMRVVMEAMARAAETARQRARASRPWWRKRRNELPPT